MFWIALKIYLFNVWTKLVNTFSQVQIMAMEPIALKILLICKYTKIIIINHTSDKYIYVPYVATAHTPKAFKFFFKNKFLKVLTILLIF